MRTLQTTLLALAGLLLATGPAASQEDPAGQEASAAAEGQEPRTLQPPRTAELIFEREVFDYPSFPRRNPFIALVASHGGPRFEQMRLRGIIHSDGPDGSVALLGLGTVEQQQNGEPEADATGRSRRIRVGETWGNVRILEIRRTEILVQVEEFGLTEERIMRLPTRGQGD